MKVLRANIYFKLPDDFNGSFNDALIELVKHRERKKHGQQPTVLTHEAFGIRQEEVDALDKADELLFNKFWYAITQENMSLVGHVHVSELKDGKWKKIGSSSSKD